MATSILELLGIAPRRKALVSPISAEETAKGAVRGGAIESPLARHYPGMRMIYKGRRPTPTSFGKGKEPAYVEPELYDALMALKATEEERRNIAELTGQESSYGYAGPHITEKEQSYGPAHINILAGRIDPETGKPFTKTGAEDIQKAIQYVLEEYRRTGGLGAWNPGAYPFYQRDIPKRAKTKKFIRGKKK